MRGKRSRTNMFNVNILFLTYNGLLIAFKVLLDSKIVEACSDVISITTVYLPIWIIDYREVCELSYCDNSNCISSKVNAELVIVFCYHMSSLTTELASCPTITSTTSATIAKCSCALETT